MVRNVREHIERLGLEAPDTADAIQSSRMLFSEGRTMMNWQHNLLHSDKQISDLLLSIRRIAVLGIKTERQAGPPAFYVPEYLAPAGLEIIPVPVYYPEVT